MENAPSDPSPKLVEEYVEMYLSRLTRPDYPGEPINWADLHCIEAKQFKDGSWLVRIGECSPEANKLCRDVRHYLHGLGITADVITEW